MTFEKWWKSYSLGDPIHPKSAKTIAKESFSAGQIAGDEKIADLKANFDYVLEGKDLELQELKDHLANYQFNYPKIKELELELTVEKDQHQEEVNLHLHAEDYIKSLEQQIEKMKCCGNCKYSNQESVYSIVCKVGGVDKSDYINIDDNQVCDKWEIKEND